MSNFTMDKFAVGKTEFVISLSWISYSNLTKFC
jgi:hypothetical protein